MLSTFTLFSVNSTKHLYSPVVYTTIDSSLRSELQILNRLRSFNCVIWDERVNGADELKKNEIKINNVKKQMVYLQWN
jgi:hypothetical protein